MSTALLERDLRLACILEATARKPGNVHPGASFADLQYGDLIESALAVAPLLARAGQLGVGRSIREAVEATQNNRCGNTNLGIILLLAPLAAVPADRTLAEGVGDVLSQLTEEDARECYRAIRLARPGGLGRVDQQDVSVEPEVTLLQAMRLAADRDTIALQYSSDFNLVLRPGLDVLASADFPAEWEQAVIGLHLWLMATRPDSLIARKCGEATAREAARRAQAVIDADWLKTPESIEQLQALDAWLRADGNRRNPGTTADLVAACLFAGFRDGRLERPPFPEHLAQPVTK